jgi:hypothetical protein
MGKKSKKDGGKALLEMDVDLSELYTAVERCKLEPEQERAMIGTHLSQLAAIWFDLLKDRGNFEGFTDEVLQPQLAPCVCGTSPVGRKSRRTSPMGKKSNQDGGKAELAMDAALATVYVSVQRCKFEEVGGKRGGADISTSSPYGV